MARKVGGAMALLLVGFGMTGTAPFGPDPDRPTWRRAYRAPVEIPFPDDNPYTQAKAELGRKLFFDPILSGDYSRACVSCHVPDLGWSDGRSRALSRHDGVMDLRTP